MSIDTSLLKKFSTSETQMSKSDFSYEVPEELVAQTPCQKRGESRLLVSLTDGEISDHRFSDIASLLSRSKPLIVRNHSRVINARINGKTETGGKIELFLLNPCDSLNWDCKEWVAMAKPLKKLKPGKTLDLGEHFRAEVISVAPYEPDSIPTVKVRLQTPIDQTVLECIEKAGNIPLPPYIKRDVSQELEAVDKDRYQTVYSSEAGSVAAPTAGLHFTRSIEDQLSLAGCEFADCILHVGAGTFLPVKSNDINQHDMHKEFYRFTSKTMGQILAAHKENRPILCVGTTSFRALESYALLCNGDEKTMMERCDSYHSTDLFIRPIDKTTKLKPSLTTMLMTNFHQPESTLIMLIGALLGYRQMKKVYTHAVEQKFRLFSYGDSSLLYFS